MSRTRAPRPATRVTGTGSGSHAATAGVGVRLLAVLGLALALLLPGALAVAAPTPAPGDQVAGGEGDREPGTVTATDEPGKKNKKSKKKQEAAAKKLSKAERRARKATRRANQDFVSAAAAPLIVEARLDGYGPITSWLGADAERTLIVSVTNSGAAPVEAPQVRVARGTADPGAAGDSEVLTARTLDPVPPGGTSEVRLPVSLGAFAFGTYQVTAAVDAVGSTGPVSVTAATSSYPWLVIALCIVLLQPLLLGLYKRRPHVLVRSTAGGGTAGTGGTDGTSGTAGATATAGTTGTTAMGGTAGTGRTPRSHRKPAEPRSLFRR